MAGAMSGARHGFSARQSDPDRRASEACAFLRIRRRFSARGSTSAHLYNQETSGFGCPNRGGVGAPS